MIVTINTDASFSRKLQRGTYAFWIVCNDFRIQKAGILRKKVHTSDQVEAKCILNALHTVFCAESKKVTRIIINTDSQNSIHVFEENKKACRKYRLNSWGNMLCLKFKMMMHHAPNQKVKVEFRHVKAHASTASKREWVNEWCDTEAKKQMKKLLTEHKI